jgi:hypothetical protein
MFSIHEYLLVDILLSIINSSRDHYLDPGSTNFIIQLLIAIGVGSLFLIRSSWSKIKLFFKKDSSQEEDQLESDSLDDN